MIMNETTLSRLSGRYLAALRVHAEDGPNASLTVAHEMGDQAVADGLDTLDLAKIHDQALAILISPDSSPLTQHDMTTRAEEFFTEASIPVEATHRAVLDATDQLKKVTGELSRRTKDLADTNLQLQRGITDRRSAEAALRTVAELPGQALEESLLLEASLQERARSILAANEEERKKMSLQLQDEIAQTLLGIHVRLLALKKESAASKAGINEEIAATQKLVEQSLKTISRFSLEFGAHHES
jgi:signal transduction histidine kinase